MVYRSLFSRLFRRKRYVLHDAAATGAETAAQPAEGAADPAESSAAEPPAAATTDAGAAEAPQAEAATIDPAPADAAGGAPVSGAPVFVIGCAPDAAAMLTGSLIDAAGLAGYREGQLLPLIQQLNRTVGQYYRAALSAAGPDAHIRQVDAATFTGPIREIFFRLMAGSAPGRDWIDNSQGLPGIQAAALLRQVWPGARFIFVASRVIESVALRAQAAPSRSTAEHVRHWIRDMQTWADLRHRFRGSSLTIDRFTVLHEPAAAAAAVAGFLALDGEQTAALAKALSRPLEAEADPVDELAMWEGAEADELRLAAAPMMTAYGYAWDTAYFTGIAHTARGAG